MYTGFHVK